MGGGRPAQLDATVKHLTLTAGACADCSYMYIARSEKGRRGKQKERDARERLWRGD